MDESMSLKRSFLDMRDEDSMIMRSGKWSSEEETYANRLVFEFERGALIDCEEGCTLRSYLARRLNCAPMRISKKFAGRCIGKMAFKKIEIDQESQEMVILELEDLHLKSCRSIVNESKKSVNSSNTCNSTRITRQKLQRNNTNDDADEERDPDYFLSNFIKNGGYGVDLSDDEGNLPVEDQTTLTSLSTNNNSTTDLLNSSSGSQFGPIMKLDSFDGGHSHNFNHYPSSTAAADAFAEAAEMFSDHDQQGWQDVMAYFSDDNELTSGYNYGRSTSHLSLLAFPVHSADTRSPTSWWTSSSPSSSAARTDSGIACAGEGWSYGGTATSASDEASTCTGSSTSSSSECADGDGDEPFVLRVGGAEVRHQTARRFSCETAASSSSDLSCSDGDGDVGLDLDVEVDIETYCGLI